jgi:hypothetical protein
MKRFARRALHVAPALVALALPFVALQDRRALAQDDDDDDARSSKVETAFTRLREGRGGGTLETAYATYKNKDTDVELTLYGAVHIADKAYYKKVMKDLASYDVVLFEMVSPSSPDTKPDESMKSIGELQSTMGEVLGLTFQKDGIDYKSKNFVHADMSYEDLLKATDGDITKALPGADLLSDPNVRAQMKPIAKMMRSFGKQLFDAMPQIRDEFKLMMARQLAGTDLSKIPGSEGATKILVGERNQVALKVLDQELANRHSGRIAIFYGAAHMKDFHQRLAAKGWTQTKVEWNVAWNMGGKKRKAAEDDDDDAPAPAPERERTPSPEKGKTRWF